MNNEQWKPYDRSGIKWDRTDSKTTPTIWTVEDLRRLPVNLSLGKKNGFMEDSIDSTHRDLVPSQLS